MESAELELLSEQARRAYEQGRLGRAARQAAPLVALPAVTTFYCATPALSLAAGAALVGLAVTLLWRGQAHGRAVVPGLLAGAPALLIPLLLPFLAGHVCMGGACWSVCVLACLGAGVVAGLGLWWASPQGPERRGFLVAASGVAALTGVPACAFAGLLGVGALLLGLLGGTTAALLRPAPAH